jgi:hypothetical protein
MVRLQESLVFYKSLNILCLFPSLLLLFAGIFKQSMGARKRVGIRLSYRPARLHRLAELIPWNRFLGSLKVKKFGFLLYLSLSGESLPLSFFKLA